MAYDAALGKGEAESSNLSGSTTQAAEKPRRYVLPSERPPIQNVQNAAGTSGSARHTADTRPPVQFADGRHCVGKAARPGTFGKIKRRGVPADIAARVLRRDGEKCIGCGERRRERLTIDHIVPVALGGDNLMGNLQTLCTGCNFDKKNHLTPAAMKRLHPEVRAEDLDFVRMFVARPGLKPTIKWTDTVHTVQIVANMRSVLVPVEHHQAVLDYLARLRDD